MLGRKLKELRFINEITQAEFAKIIGVSQQAVGNWEKNLTYPNIETLKKIAKYFKVSIDYLLDNESKSITEKQHELITGYEELDDEGRILLMSILKSLKAAHTRLAR